jgi:hypothetical protein
MGGTKNNFLTMSLPKRKLGRPWEGINGDMVHDSWGYNASMFSIKK